ncbi:MAG: DUF5680 domain-containing protein [bacterium]
MNAKQRKSFLSFLFWARRTHGYAGGAKGDNLLRGGKQFTCSRGVFSYGDTFLDQDPFIGQETVWHADRGWLWGMNYYGAMLRAGKRTLVVSAEETYMFLKFALLECDVTAPYRGPKSHAEGNWVYENEWTPWSKLERFCGTEAIFYKGILVYQGEYHGGVIGTK